MTSAKGSLDLLSKDDDVGTALTVHLKSLGSAFAVGEGDMHELGGSRISGGGS